jgi:DNA-binding transcriptional regulator YiaG
MEPDELRELRLASGLSQQALADLMGLGVGGGRTVRRWEAGEVAISGPVAIAVKAVLEQRQAA